MSGALPTIFPCARRGCGNPDAAAYPLGSSGRLSDQDADPATGQVWLCPGCYERTLFGQTHARGAGVCCSKSGAACTRK
jgi:hypothetical protein